MKFEKGAIIFLIIILVFSYFSVYDWPFFTVKQIRAASWTNGYIYRKQISVDNTKVSGAADLTDFPVLVSITDNDLKATSSGGKVEDTNGYDIVFMSEGSTTSTLDFEVESYSSSTGELIAWVKVPIVYYGTNTDIYMYYGNELATSSQESATGVWSDNYKGVWHLGDNPAGSGIVDSTSNNNDGTVSGAMTTDDQVTGKISGSLDFDGTDDHVNFGSGSSLDLTEAITIEAWVQGTSSDTIISDVRRSSSNISNPLMQVAGEDVYYSWVEDANYKYIWTGKMNAYGSGWSASQKVTTSSIRNHLDFQVTEDGIYYVWAESDGSNKQIWTGDMALNGTGWVASKRTSSTLEQVEPELHSVGTKIYYIWNENPIGTGDIWTGSMDDDGLNWNASKRTVASAYRKKANPQLQVSGSTIYLSWIEQDEELEIYQVASGNIGTDGKSFSYFLRTAAESMDYGSVRMQVDGSNIYFTWVDDDFFQSSGANTQIWTGSIATGGSSWSATQRTSNSDWYYSPQMQLTGDKVNYAWYNSSSTNRLWEGSLDTDGSNWSETMNSSSGQAYPAFQVVGGKTYYFWVNSTGSSLVTAEKGANIINKGDFYGLGISSTTAKAFVNAGPDTFKYKKIATAYSAGAEARTTIDNTWNHLVMTYDKVNLKFYLNGSLVDSYAYNQNISTADFGLILGDDWEGLIDEVRVSSVARSADWVATLYNNQNSPSTFYTVGVEHESNNLSIASSVTVDSGADAVVLLEGTTKNVVCSAIITDADGWSDFASVTAKFYRSGIGAGAADDNDNHYTVSGSKATYCSSTDANSGTCSVTIPVYFYAEPTDSGAYSGQNWVCEITPYDTWDEGIADTYSLEMNTLQSLDVSSAINYGSILPNSASTGDNTAIVTNTGNNDVDFQLSGETMTCSIRGSISASAQEYKLTSFSYGAGIDLTDSLADVDASLAKATSDTPTSTDTVYWQLSALVGLKGTCTSSVTFLVRSAIVEED